MSIKMLRKNCHQVLRSQKSKLTPIELVFETAGAINPPPTKIGLRDALYLYLYCILFINVCTPNKQVLKVGLFN